MVAAIEVVPRNCEENAVERLTIRNDGYAEFLEYACAFQVIDREERGKEVDSQVYGYSISEEGGKVQDRYGVLVVTESPFPPVLKRGKINKKH